MIADLYRYPKLAGSLVVMVLASFGVFIWAVYRNAAIGLRASASGTSGGADQAAWLWLFASLAILVAATCGLVIVLCQAVDRGSRERRALKEGEPNTGMLP
jgi:hypothetical protein